MTRAAALVKYLKDIVVIVVIQMVNGIRVIPVDPEILCLGLKRGEASDDLVGIGITLRVGVFRNAPDALYRFVLRDVLFDKIHIRSLRGHRNVYHLDAEIPGDPEVPVIPRHRAEEFHPVKPAPRCISHNAVSIRPRNGVVHDVEA